MKIVKILGGLGNQMFQYALLQALEKQFKEKVYSDTTLFSSYKVHNGLEIERVFGVQLNQAPKIELKRLTRYTTNFKLSRMYRKFLPTLKTECLEAKDYTLNKSVLTLNADRYYDGYWQNYLYFDSVAEQLQQIYTFKNILDTQNLHLLQTIKHTKSISVHIRRGDYLKAKNYSGLCEKEYYKKAIQYGKQKIENAHFFIFSNDIEWCKKNLADILEKSPYSFIDWNTGNESYKDMQLMSECQHNIIANSSFSWWAAWLNNNPDKMVIAPEKWTNTKVNCKFQMPDWVLL